MENKDLEPLQLPDRKTSKLKSNKFRHGSLATIFTVIFIVLIILLNVVVSALTDRFPSMNMDMTAEKLNTLSETAVDTAKKVEKETVINIIGAEDVIRGDKIYTNYGLQYSQVANLADKMQEANSKIKVKFIDPDIDPAFISQYPDDGLAAGTVLVKTDARYKVLTVTDLFSLQQNQQDGTYKQYSQVDGALSNAVYLTNLDSVPVVAVATGHNEMLATEARATFDQLMKDSAFDVKEFSLLTEEIPAEAQVLMLATPQTDYSKDEIKKMQDFLAITDDGKSRTLLITCHPTQGTLPNLATFLEDWGVKVNQGVVVENDANNMLSGAPNGIFVNASTDIFPDTTYDKLLALSAVPLELTFKSQNDISTYALMETADTAYVSVDETLAENPETSKQVVASISQKLTTVDNAPVRSNVVVMGSTVSLLQDFLGGNTFANRQFTTDLMKYGTGTTDKSQSLYVTPTETNVTDITATAAVVQGVGLYFFTIILPIAILIAGLVIFLRRRHL